MPRIKTKRSDIMRKEEILETIQKAETVGSWLQCLIAIAWIFGKRINEILRVKREDVWVERKFLYIRFLVSKKKTRESSAIPQRYLKRKTLKHPGTAFIISYIKNISEGYIFPDATQKEKTIKVYNKKYDKWYSYTLEGGHISRHKAKYFLKKINPDIWWHLLRESLATEMAEREATEEELMHWFDWDDPRTAHRYVKRGTKLTEKWSEKAW